MSIFNVISLLGGLALFLYGMTVMSNSLESASGGKLEEILEKMTSNIVKATLCGCIVTGVIQSSSATTVIVVGLVNARILKLRQAIGIIMGANIGTTVTAHILRLSDLEGNPVLMFLKPATLAPLAAIIGILLYMIAKKKQHKDIGLILVGFGILFTGMFAMEEALLPLQDIPQFRAIFTSFSNPILGVLVGTGVTALIQSSSASIGILQALTVTGAITCSAAFPIIMGQNIGTCITPVLSSIGASKNAKRTAFIHVMFNFLGTIIFLVAIYTIQYTVGFSFWNEPISRGGIANFHTLFNVTITLIFLPFSVVLEKLALFFIRDDEDEKDDTDADLDALDERFLSSPSFAIGHARDVVIKMGELSSKNFHRSVELVHKMDRKKMERARESENVIDRLQGRVNQYLLKLTQQELTEAQNLSVSEALQVIIEFERIGDHADNICDCADIIVEQGISFSDQALTELGTVADAVNEIIDLAVQGYIDQDVSMVDRVEPLEEVIDILVETLKVRHSERLKKGICSVDSAFSFLEILNDMERISDHCSNVGAHVYSYSGLDQKLDRHEYLRDVHHSQTAEYKSKFDMYDAKYFDRIKEK